MTRSHPQGRQQPTVCPDNKASIRDGRRDSFRSDGRDAGRDSLKRRWRRSP